MRLSISITRPIQIISTLLVLFTAQVSAATYYVSPAGDDKNNGSSEREPFKLVQHAIDSMSAGDTLLVLDGLYSGTLKLKSGIHIKAKNPRRVIFTGAESIKAEFVKHKGEIYKARISGNPKQVFFNGTRMT